MIKKIVQRLLSVVGIVILGIFIYTIDLESTIESLQNLSVPMIVMVLAIMISHILVKSFRWKALIYRISRKNIGMKFSFLSIIAGVAFGSITPGRIEMAKPIMLKKKSDVPISASLSGVFMERICDFFGLLSIILLSLFFIPSQKVINSYLLFTVLIIIFLITLLLTLFPQKYYLLGKWIIDKIPFPENTKKKLNKFTEGFFSTFNILKNKNLLSFLVLFSILAIILEVLQFHLILRFLGVDVNLALSAFVLTSTTILGVLSMIPGGTGIIEISSAAILMVFISGSETAIQSSILINRIISYYLLILIGALIMIFYEKSKHEKLS